MTAARLPTQLQGRMWAWPGLPLPQPSPAQLPQSTPAQRPSRTAAAPVGSQSPPVAGASCFSIPDGTDQAAQPLPAPPAPSRFPQAAPYTQTHPPGGPEESPSYRAPWGFARNLSCRSPPNPRLRSGGLEVEVLLVGAGREVRGGVLEAGRLT